MLEIEEAFNILEEEYKKQKILLNKIHTIKEYLFDLEADLEEEKAENYEKAERIDKAIEYISNNCILSNEWTDLDFCNFVPTGNIKYKQLTSKEVKYLLSILRGEDNE